MTIYKTTTKYTNTTKQDVWFARVGETIRHGGRDFTLYHIIKGDEPSIQTYLNLDGWEPAELHEWANAVARAEKAEHQRRLAASARADGEAFGIRVSVCDPYTGITTRETVIVRATRTRLISVNGTQWSRDKGREIGSMSARAYIGSASLIDLEDYLAGRERVDIVAERKAAAREATP